MDYYERYWKRELEEGGVASHPPIWNVSQLKYLISIIQPFCQGDVLDVGCGEGTFTSQLAKLNKVRKVIGIDISSEAVSSARHKLPEIDFEAMSTEQLMFSNETFDIITVVEVVEHVLDIKKMFKEFNRVLRLNGKLFITTTNFNLLKKAMIAIFFWDKYFYPTNPHIRFFTKSTLKDILIRTGFKIILHKWNKSYFGIMPKGQIVVAEKIRRLNHL